MANTYQTANNFTSWVVTCNCKVTMINIAHNKTQWEGENFVEVLVENPDKVVTSGLYMAI